MPEYHISRPFLHNISLQKLLVTAISGFIEEVGNMIKGIPKHNYHQSITRNSIYLQRASRDTCLPAKEYQFICIHLLAIT